jgi:23S rRNA pseudouridine2604 synthase
MPNMKERPRLGLKPDSPARDPQRPAVRGLVPSRTRRASLPVSNPTAPRPAPSDTVQRRESPPAHEGTRLSKVMAERGIASRREADEWIEAGWVRVNGRLAVLGQRVQGNERIDIDPAARQEQGHRVTILMHKPLGYVSGQAEDGHEPAAVLVTADRRWAQDRGRPWHPGHGRGLAPAGRLDLDSTGLLVLTQDGRIARHLIGEDSDVEKEYLVRVAPMAAGSFRENGLDLLRHGLALDGRPLLPAKASWANEDQLRIVLREGRKRQVRRMCELVGLKVLALRRVRIGSVVLGALPVGQWRYLRDDERF